MDYLYPLQNSMIDYLFCFFSSSRRHTRWPRDWSSDVCSSDLGEGQGVAGSGADGIGPVVEQGVVSSAEADQVVQVGGPAVEPVHDVVPVGPLMWTIATRISTAVVPVSQGAALGRGDQPGPAAHIQRQRVRAEHDPGDGRVAEQAVQRGLG